jgi:hypothetical protein
VPKVLLLAALALVAVLAVWLTLSASTSQASVGLGALLGLVLLVVMFLFAIGRAGRVTVMDGLEAAARRVSKGKTIAWLLAPSLDQMTEEQEADYLRSTGRLGRVEAAIEARKPQLVRQPGQPEGKQRLARRKSTIPLFLVGGAVMALFAIGIWKLVDLSKELVASTADRAMRGESVAPLGSPFLPRPIAIEASLLPAPNERAQVTGLDYYAEGLFRRGCLLYLGESGGRVVLFGPLRSAPAGQTDTSSHSSYRLDANELPPLEPCNGSAKGGAGTVRTGPP